MTQLNNTWFTNNIEPNAEGFLQETIANDPSIAAQLYSSPVAIQNILDFANQFGSQTTYNMFTTFLSGETVQFNSNTPAVTWNANLSADANVQVFIMATPYGSNPATQQSEINRENAFDTAIANETITPTEIEVSAQSGAGGNAATLNNLQNVAVVVDPGVIFTTSGTNDNITLSSNDTLILNNPTTFTGTITNVAPGNTIDLAGIGTATSATLGADNVLTVHGGSSGTVTLDLDPSQNFIGEAFAVASDGNGGTDITVGNASGQSGTYEFDSYRQYTG